jgi:GrpB-like predicted nucleotidyltransferase (UPF0157 family)
LANTRVAAPGRRYVHVVSFVDEPVTISPHDPRWQQEFAREAARLQAALAGVALGIEHIGSTAVPGLPAKAIVDVMVGVASRTDHDTVARLLAPLGYEDCGGAPGRRYLRKRPRDGQHCNVQVLAIEGELWRANLRFREHLRAHPEAVRRYSEAKRRAAREAPALLAYSKLKDDVIAELLAQAS